MPRVSLEELLAAGAHFGHLTRRWNPKVKPYIFMERNGIHIIDLKKTQELLDIACDQITKIVSEGKKVLFVGTKRQAKGIIEQEAQRCGTNYVTERWLGGMLTNFATIRKSVKRLNNIEKMEADGTVDKITKKEALFLSREKIKLQKVLNGIVDMTRLPGCLFIVDIKKEHIAVKEAKKLGIPIVAIVDTNCDPDPIDFVIPANDDSGKTIQIIASKIADSIIEGKEKNKLLRAEEEAVKEQQEKINESVVEEDTKEKKN
ncbi:MAG TPA: 30S ribosomal protein S2 [Bacteroidota bacterium]|jgi:small subunit ribosomal protein S2|nr:30S ribosomal protein S2 [Bacteroidota bacterium]